MINESSLVDINEDVMHFKFRFRLMVFFLILIILVILMGHIDEVGFINIKVARITSIMVKRHSYSYFIGN